MIMNMESFVYKWTYKPTMDWYVGWHKGSPIDGYICSSRIVKNLIKLVPEDWERIIVATGSCEDMYALETAILEAADAKRDCRSFNRHNNNKSFYRVGIAPTNKGKTISEETRAKQRARRLGVSPSNKGIKGVVKNTLEQRLNKSLAAKGKPKSPTHIENARNALIASGSLKGKTPWNKGIALSDKHKANISKTKQKLNNHTKNILTIKEK
jgi:hypothetical protein